MTEKQNKLLYELREALVLVDDASDDVNMKMEKLKPFIKDLMRAFDHFWKAIDV